MVRYLGGVIRTHSRTTLLILILVVLTASGAGFYEYAVHQWRSAQAAVKEGRFDDARGSLDFCLRVWPRSTEVHILAARVDRLSGNYDGAEAHLNQCLKIERGATPDIQVEFLLMRVQRGEVDEVAPALFEFVDSNHRETPLILETLSRAYMYNLRWRPAYRCLDRWILEVPDSARAHYWRGWVIERMSSHPEAAMTDYQRALELDEGQVAVRLRIVEILLQKSNVPAALPHLERLMQDCPDRPDVMARMGQCCYLQNKRAEARRLLEAAVEKLPEDPVLLITLARVDLADKQPVRAEEWVRRVLKADPTDLEARYTLVNCLQLQGRRQEAETALKLCQEHKALLDQSDKLLKDEDEHPTHNPEAAFALGEILLRVGQDRLAIYWLTEALNRDSRHQPTHQLLAEYYEKKGEPTKAAAHRTALKTQPRPAAQVPTLPVSNQEPAGPTRAP